MKLASLFSVAVSTALLVFPADCVASVATDEKHIGTVTTSPTTDDGITTHHVSTDPIATTTSPEAGSKPSVEPHDDMRGEAKECSDGQNMNICTSNDSYGDDEYNDSDDDSNVNPTMIGHEAEETSTALEACNLNVAYLNGRHEAMKQMMGYHIDEIIALEDSFRVAQQDALSSKTALEEAKKDLDYCKGTSAALSDDQKNWMGDSVMMEKTVSDLQKEKESWNPERAALEEIIDQERAASEEIVDELKRIVNSMKSKYDAYQGEAENRQENLKSTEKLDKPEKGECRGCDECALWDHVHAIKKLKRNMFLFSFLFSGLGFGVLVHEHFKKQQRRA